MGSASVWLVSLVLCWGLPSPHTTLSYAAVYYVTPHTPNPDCPTSGEPCLTLNEYAQGDHFDGDDNITLLFLDGEHSLTTQDLEIADKVWLEMAPHLEAMPVIQIANTVSIVVRHVSEVKISKLEFNSQSSDNDSRPTCLSISNTGLFSADNISTRSCQWSLQGDMNATITELTAFTSCIHSFSNHIAIRNSTFHFSKLDISDSLASEVSSTHNTTSALTLESSSMNNSLVTVKLQTQIVYELSILDTSITSGGNVSLKTGIKAETNNTSTLHTLIKNCRLVGNYYGIRFVADGKSSVTLDVDQCHIAHNGNVGTGAGILVMAERNSHIELNVDQCLIKNNGYNDTYSEKYGGVIIMSQCPQSNEVTIKSSTLTGNNPTQVGVLASNKTVVTVTVFNYTLNGGTSHSSGLSVTARPGSITDVSNQLIINLTKNFIEETDDGVWIEGIRETSLTLYLTGNNISSNKVNGLSIVTPKLKLIMSIKNCIFFRNTKAAIVFDYIFSEVQMTISEIVIAQNNNGIVFPPAGNGTLEIKDSQFQENIGNSLGGFMPFQTTTRSDFFTTLKNVTFFNNTNQPNAGIVQVISTIHIENSTFKDNRGSPIHALSTTVILSGAVIFENNLAYQGGALYLNNSTLTLASNNDTITNIMIVNNTATNTGGGIYVDQNLGVLDNYTGSICFFSTQGVSAEKLNNMTIVFRDNKATNGGTSMYGATPNSHCPIGTINEHISSFQQDIFTMTHNLSSVSSDPKRVCLCDSSSQLQCANYSYIFYKAEHYPGGVFTISLAVVGFEFGTVDGSVYISLLAQVNNLQSSLGNDEHMKQLIIENKVTPVNFTVNSLNKLETIALAINNTLVTMPDAHYHEKISSAIRLFNEDQYHVIPSLLLTTFVYINITLLDCPPGFNLSNQGKCECGTEFKKIGIDDCPIYNNTPYVVRSGNQWIMTSNDSILTSNYCPFYYCQQKTMHLNPNTPDEQCALNHTGILCGGCPPSLSLAIGSSRCIECTDSYHILLLIAFAAAGILLVLLIKCLDMTVTMGTINGLIFYANITWANQSILFPPQANTSTLLLFLRAFIAWLNLDLGIETCFIQQLDGYWKTWLQFAFPAYIWLIVGLIILVSHYSIRATKILGNNSLHVLTTLFLLSYAKLLRTILVIMEFAVVEYSDGQRVVWLFDGNVEYLGLKHSFLFVVAIAILLVLWLPYTFVLLFIHFLRKYSQCCLLRWVNKLNPLFASYLGPLKDKHQYWIGLGLFARLILLLTSTITSTTIPLTAALLITITASLLSFLVPSVYKQWQLSLLEGCFLVNLVIFSSGTLLIETQQGGGKDSLACVSLGVSFILFLVIIGYHLWKRLQSLKRRLNANNGYEKIDNIQAPPQPTTYQEVPVPTLREPLLESD